MTKRALLKSSCFTIDKSIIFVNGKIYKFAKATENGYAFIDENGNRLFKKLFYETNERAYQLRTMLKPKFPRVRITLQTKLYDIISDGYAKVNEMKKSKKSNNDGTIRT